MWYIHHCSVSSFPQIFIFKEGFHFVSLLTYLFPSHFSRNTNIQMLLNLANLNHSSALPTEVWPTYNMSVWLFVGYFLTATYTQELTISQPKHLQGSCSVPRFAWRNNPGGMFLSGKSKGFLALSLWSIYVLAVGNRVI